MPTDAPPQSPQRSSASLWTPSQLRGLAVLLALYAGITTFNIHQNNTLVSETPPSAGPRAAELTDRIDPNTADWQTIAAIPTIGEKRAHDIVAYREQHLAHNPSYLPFHMVDDLYPIRGVGPATLETLRQFLKFPPRTAPLPRHTESPGE